MKETLKEMIKRVIKEESSTNPLAFLEVKTKDGFPWEELVASSQWNEIKSKFPQGSMSSSLGKVQYCQFEDGQVFLVINNSAIVADYEYGESFLDGTYPSRMIRELRYYGNLLRNCLRSGILNGSN